LNSVHIHHMPLYFISVLVLSTPRPSKTIFFPYTLQSNLLCLLRVLRWDMTLSQWVTVGSRRFEGIHCLHLQWCRGPREFFIPVCDLRITYLPNSSTFAHLNPIRREVKLSKSSLWHFLQSLGYFVSIVCIYLPCNLFTNFLNRYHHTQHTHTRTYVRAYARTHAQCRLQDRTHWNHWRNCYEVRSTGRRR
jgi:hypothetical protein